MPLRLLPLVVVSLIGCDQWPSAGSATPPPSPMSAQRAMLKQALDELRARIDELRLEYKNNRAKLELDMNLALKKVRESDLDSDQLVIEIVDLTGVVKEQTQTMDRWSDEIRARLRELRRKTDSAPTPTPAPQPQPQSTPDPQPQPTPDPAAQETTL